MTDVSHLNIYISWVITALVGAFGIGVGYTALKSNLLHMKDRLNKIEIKVDQQVGWERYLAMRKEDNERLVLNLADITKQIGMNRDVVVAQMRETEKFIGRVEQYMLKNGSKV